LLDDARIRNPDPGDPKTYGSYRSGSGCGSGSAIQPTRNLWCVLYRAAAQSVMDCLQHYESLPARTETPEQAAALTQPTQVV